MSVMGQADSGEGVSDPSRALCILCHPHLPQALCVSQNHLSVGLSRTSGVHGAQDGDTASSGGFSETGMSCT